MSKAIQQVAFEAILTAEQARMRAIGGPNDWRIKLYAKSKWEMRVLKANFNAGKQGVTLPKGTVVAAQKSPPDTERAYDQWCILHGNLLCKTSLGPNFAKYI